MCLEVGGGGVLEVVLSGGQITYLGEGLPGGLVGGRELWKRYRYSITKSNFLLESFTAIFFLE